MSFIEGVIKQYLYFSEESSYSVVKVEIRDTAEAELLHFEPTIVVCGFFPMLELGQVYRFYGKVTEHPKYGVQYSASRFERIMDTSKAGIIDYLASDL
ncbi:MAG: ATP-dependent RecD-like DNA helicase, partial [Bacilli bacterium]|nr:ATP-dependent RecD-like DNA helicase [Bacilli bacterium]